MHIQIRLAAIILILSAALSEGRDIYVATNGAGGGSPSYGTWGTASSNIEWAVNVGVNDDTVWISNGVYVLTNQITVSSNITIRGVAGDTIVVDGNNAVRPFYIPSASVVLSNLFITRGTNSDSGGGVSIKYGAMLDCVFSNNNSGASGGGLYVAASGTNLIRGCTFIQNGASTGGGGLVMLGSAMVQDCTVEGNTAAGYGGGVYFSNGGMRNCLIRNNVANRNGSGFAEGAGIYMANSGIISGCTVVSNWSDRPGAGISVKANIFGNFENCIIYFNVGDPAWGPFGSNCYVVTSSSFTNCCLAPAPSGDSATYSTNNITTDPQFVDWTNGNYRLSRNSQCINAGVNRDWMIGTVDLDSHRRVDKFSGRVDIGCYEYLPSGVIFNIK